MDGKILHMQELEVFYVLPAIRSKMAAAMKEQGMKQKEIAKTLLVQESTVSQYLNSRRAADTKFSEKLDEEIKKSVKNISTTEGLMGETQRILGLFRAERSICGLCRTQNDSISDGCSVCFTERK
jgi:uncharacterized protein